MLPQRYGMNTVWDAPKYALITSKGRMLMIRTSSVYKKVFCVRSCRGREMFLRELTLSFAAEKP